MTDSRKRFPGLPRWASWLAIFSFLFVLAGSCWAQSQAINGTIRGRVVDASSAALPNASVTVLNTATGFTRTVQSGTDGYYVVPNLPLGTYTVTGTHDGFTAIKHSGIVLEAGRDAVIDFSLKVGSVNTTVEVTGGAPVVDPARVNIGRTINTREVQTMPLTSRNPYNFILFQPGVSGHPNPELGIPRTVNTNGLLDRINYQMDGMVDTQSDRYGLRLFPISDSYVREVQTIANSAAPEFGGTAGNIFNVITNSGTNDVHGMFQYIGRPSSTSARPILLNPSRPKPDLTLNDYSGNVGGPAIKNKLFWFASYEHDRRGSPAATTIDPANAAQLGISQNLLATAPGTLHAQFFDTRVDWNINNNNQFFIRYNYFRNDFPFNTNVGGLNALDAGSDFKDRAHVLGLQLISTITPNLLNELRFSVPYRKNTHLPNPVTGPGPQIVIPGVATFNGTTGAGDFFAEKIPSGNDNVTWIHGTHTIKTGFGFQEMVDVQQGDIYTQYTFPTIQAYLDAKSGVNPRSYSSFAASIGDTRAAYRSKFWNAFVQDSWQVTPSLLMTYGVRYDRFISPAPDANAPFIDSRSFRNPGADFAPRVGLAWKVDDKTVVRASGGIFYDAPPTNLWFNSFSNDGSGRAYIAHVSSAQGPAFPNTVTTTTAPANPDVTTVSPNFKNTYVVNGSLQVSRALTQNDSITVGYVYTGGRQLEFLRDINLINPTGTLADGRPVYATAVSASTRLYPQFNHINMQDVGANSSYNALLATFEHRWARGYQVSASYTWSHTLSNAPDINAFEQNLPIEDPSNRNRDYGNAYINRPNSLTLSTVLAPVWSASNPFLHRLINDNELSVLVNASSGDAQNVRANTVLNGDSSTSSVTRPIGIGRNTMRGPAIYQLDLRYTRTIAKLWDRVSPQFFVEANNVLNHPNITGLNTVTKVDGNGFAVPTAGFGAPSSSVLESRILQFGVEVKF